MERVVGVRTVVRIPLKVRLYHSILDERGTKSPPDGFVNTYLIIQRELTEGGNYSMLYSRGAKTR